MYELANYYSLTDNVIQLTVDFRHNILLVHHDDDDDDDDDFSLVLYYIAR